MNINQNNIFGNNNIFNYVPKMDVRRLHNFVQTEGLRIKTILESIAGTNVDTQNDDNYILLTEKNELNELTAFYDEFIKKHESKLSVLHNYFQQNDYSNLIDSVAEHLKRSIFSFKNQGTGKLTPEIMNFIIETHSNSFDTIEDKDIVTYCIYYLYRHCFIGIKEK